MSKTDFFVKIYIHGGAKCVAHVIFSLKSRSEQAPGSVFYPPDKSEKNYCDVLGPSWCNIKVDPEI